MPRHPSIDLEQAAGYSKRIIPLNINDERQGQQPLLYILCQLWVLKLYLSYLNSTHRVDTTTILTVQMS